MLSQVPNLPLSHTKGYMSLYVCLLACAMPLQRFTDSLRSFLQDSSGNVALPILTTSLSALRHSMQEHLEHLCEVFARLRKAGLRLKAKKCLFLRKEVTYLGYVVTKNGIKPDNAKTDKMQNYPAPTDVSQVKQLGLAPYYRRFVPDFFRIASPLHSLLKKNPIFQ